MRPRPPGRSSHQRHRRRGAMHVANARTVGPHGGDGLPVGGDFQRVVEVAAPLGAEERVAGRMLVPGAHERQWHRAGGGEIDVAFDLVAGGGDDRIADRAAGLHSQLVASSPDLPSVPPPPMSAGVNGDSPVNVLYNSYSARATHSGRPLMTILSNSCCGAEGGAGGCGVGVVVVVQTRLPLASVLHSWSACRANAEGVQTNSAAASKCFLNRIDNPSLPFRWKRGSRMRGAAGAR